jgi:uncharacterized protein (DUF302 family)
MSYTIRVELDEAFDTVVDRTVDALAEEGFGVLSDIDVAETFAAKLDLKEPYRNYRILGACNPGLAHEGLEAERSLGTLLPCNVVVYEADDGTVVVEAVDPETLIGVADNPELDGLAEEVRERLERALEAL